MSRVTRKCIATSQRVLRIGGAHAGKEEDRHNRGSERDLLHCSSVAFIESTTNAPDARNSG